MTVYASFQFYQFYAELNAFLVPSNRQRPVFRACPKGASLKHMIKVFGIPHTEVDLILANEVSAGFEHPIRSGDLISVYPYFGMRNVSPLLMIPFRPLRGDRFIADLHLGRLAAQLRMLGFDVLHDNHYPDREIAGISAEENRIVLSRDRNRLIHKKIERGCFIHAISPDEQVLEIMNRLDLSQNIRPFTCCLRCNGLLHDVDACSVTNRVPQRSRQYYSRPLECSNCRNIYGGLAYDSDARTSNSDHCNSRERNLPISR